MLTAWPAEFNRFQVKMTAELEKVINPRLSLGKAFGSNSAAAPPVEMLLPLKISFSLLLCQWKPHCSGTGLAAFWPTVVLWNRIQQKEFTRQTK